MSHLVTVAYTVFIAMTATVAHSATFKTVETTLTFEPGADLDGYAFSALIGDENYQEKWDVDGTTLATPANRVLLTNTFDELYLSRDDGVQFRIESFQYRTPAASGLFSFAIELLTGGGAERREYRDSRPSPSGLERVGDPFGSRFSTGFFSSSSANNGVFDFYILDVGASEAIADWIMIDNIVVSRQVEVAPVPIPPAGTLTLGAVLALAIRRGAVRRS